MCMLDDARSSIKCRCLLISVVCFAFQSPLCRVGLHRSTRARAHTHTHTQHTHNTHTHNTHTHTHTRTHNPFSPQVPHDAGTAHPDAGVLLAAFKLVERELVRRDALSAKQLQRDAVSSASVTVSFGDCGSLPRDVVVDMFRYYLPQRELLRSCARVCKEWHTVATDPHLWQSLGDSTMYTRRFHRLPITAVVQLVSRPQFSLLKRLALSNKDLKFGKNGIAQIARGAPGLVMLNICGIKVSPSFYVLCGNRCARGRGTCQPAHWRNRSESASQRFQCGCLRRE
jgi:hypothetical protein